MQIIKDFLKYLDYANLGIEKDYSMILHKITFVESYANLDKINYIYEFLKNN